MNSDEFKQWRRSYGQSLTPFQQKPLIMGILNVTPDSFSDGGCYLGKDAALERAVQMIREGADLIDVGGESSRPGALPISCTEELDRVIPVIEALRVHSDICISIDTTKTEVMKQSIAAGASMINNISAFVDEDSLASAVVHGVPLCLMHMQGQPSTMQGSPQYKRDVVHDVNLFFQERIESCTAAGVERENIILDPGFGFGKTVQHNLSLVRQLATFQQHQLPILLGLSRKSTIGKIVGQSVEQRLIGGLTLTLFAATQGLAIIRTHDVKETNQALIMHAALNKY